MTKALSTSKISFTQKSRGYSIVKWTWTACSAAFIIFGAWVAQTRYFKEVTTIVTDCRCMLEDACWPSIVEWSQFNESIGGRLERTIPIGSPCHDPEYDEEKCRYLKDHWTSTYLQYVNRQLELAFRTNVM